MKSYKEEFLGTLVALIIVFVLGSFIGYIGYGDWTCGFTTCVKVK